MPDGLEAIGRKNQKGGQKCPPHTSKMLVTALEFGLGGNRAQLFFFFAGCFVQRDRLGFDCALLTEGVE